MRNLLSLLRAHLSPNSCETAEFAVSEHYFVTDDAVVEPPSTVIDPVVVVAVSVAIIVV